MSHYYKSAVIPWQDWNQFLTVSDTGQVLNLESSQIVSSQQKTPDSIIEFAKWYRVQCVKSGRSALKLQIREGTELGKLCFQPHTGLQSVVLIRRETPAAGSVFIMYSCLTLFKHFG